MSSTGPKGRYDSERLTPSAVQRLDHAPSDPDAMPLRQARVTVDAAHDLGVLDRPWASLGYDEINWTYTPQGGRTLRTIGDFAETPYHVRPHNIFNSGTGLGLPHWGSGNVYHEDADGRPYLRRPRPARRLRLVPHQGLALHPVAHLRPDRRAGTGAAVAVDPEDAPRDRPRARRHRGVPQYAGKPVIVDECDASVPALWGIYDNANFAYRYNEYYPVFQAKLMKKVLDLNAQRTREGA